MVKRMTMADLADLAGIDISTVSRALRGDARRVAASTIERVQALAREVGYVPDANASSLRTRKTHVIGMLVPDLTDVVHAELYEEVSAAAADQGYLAIVSSTRGEDDRRSEAARRMLSRRVDGVILSDASRGRWIPGALAGSGTPFVLVMRATGRYPAVVADDAAGGRLAAEHLLGLGHRSVCVVAGPPGITTVEERLSGFLDAFEHAGVPVPPDAIAFGAIGVEGGFLSMAELLSARPNRFPTAVFAMNDYNAIGAARALREHGALPGRDVALVGFNDIAIGGYLETPLTTVRVDHRQMGREAVALLLRRIRGETVRRVVIPPVLVVRESSAKTKRSAGRPKRPAARPARPAGGSRRSATGTSRPVIGGG